MQAVPFQAYVTQIKDQGYFLIYLEKEVYCGQIKLPKAATNWEETSDNDKYYTFPFPQ